MNRAFACLLAGALLAVGVVLAQGPGEPKLATAELARGRIRLTPVDLFPGELKRLQPHLEISGVCYKIEYSGPEIAARLFLEEWKGGVRDEYISHGVGVKRQPEISLSIKPAPDENGRPGSRVLMHITGQGGSATVPITFETPKLERTVISIRKLEKVIELKPEEEIVLWARLHVKTGEGIEAEKPIAELLKKSEYALVWKFVPDRKE